jgi:uncharacterized membrane protein
VDAILPGLKAMLNYHPVFVHFPIALWLGALLFEALAAARSSAARGTSKEELHRTAVLLLYLGTLSAFFAVGTGLLAEDSVPQSSPAHDVMELHQTLTLIATSLAGLCMAAFFLRENFTSRRRKIFLFGLVALAALMAVGADRGAQLVYQYGTGVNWPAARK